MSVKPILFNTEMVRAILDGRKSCTRRIAKPQPDWNHTYPLGFVNDSTERKDVGSFGFGTNELGGSIQYAKPPYQPGDILYVRETWKCWRAHRYEATADIIFKTGGDGVRLQFANGSIDSVNRFDYDTFVNKWLSYHGEWKPAIHMPKEAARIWLKVTDVRVERLQEITEDGAKAEWAIDNRGFIHSTENEYVSIYTAREHFTEIWNSTIKKSDIDRYGWDANPYVFVIEFERCEKPEVN